MPLLDLWKSNPDGIKAYAIRQVVAMSGDGRLRDGSHCSNEFRTYLQEAPSSKLEIYARECLEDGFEDSGFVLQDVVNEIGRRLEFDVENGRYRGTTTALGFDGIWRVGSDQAIVVEVKTTDTFNARLDDVAEYCRALEREGRAPANTSTLFVVGRKDSGALEAQIRGSRHAWDMRVVGVESLVKLMRVKEKSSEDSTVGQIREILRPFEYTRVDRIVDVVFDTANDVSLSDVVDPAAGFEIVTATPNSAQILRTDTESLAAMRDRIIASLERTIGSPLVPKRRALFETADSKTRICVSISKRYSRDYQPYWYAYHPSWDEFLSSADNASFVLGCMDREDAFCLPFALIRSFLPKLNQTVREDGKTYWHVVVTTDSDGALALYSSKTGDMIKLAPFSMKLDPV